MSKLEIRRLIGGALVLLMSIAVGLGSLQLWNGVPASWSDVIATAETVKGVARGMAAMSAILVVSGVATVINLGWGRLVASISVAVFVAAGFWANHVLFGSVRPMHTGPNVVIALLILWLLRTSRPGR